MDKLLLPGRNQDYARDRAAFEAGVRAAIRLAEADAPLEQAIEQWGPLLEVYLGAHGLSTSQNELEVAWPTIVAFCDGYAEVLVHHWRQRRSAMALPYDWAANSGRRYP